MRWAHGDPDSVAREILRGPDYRTLAPSRATPPGDPWWVVWWNWLVDHVLRPIFGPLLHGIGHAIGASKGIGTVVGFVLIALAIAGLAFVLARLVIAFLPRFARGDGSAGVATSLDAERSHDDWLALARDASARGDYRRAIGALFAAALAMLDDRALVAFDAARTPGEYRRLVRHVRVDAGASFDALADRFVRATYAEAPPGRTDFDAAERAFAALDPLVRA